MTLFDPFDDEFAREHARANDHWTSWKAAHNAEPRARGQQRAILQTYASRDLIDEEAVRLAGRGSWRRCSDLREKGFIEPIVGETRRSSFGNQSIVCRITSEGLAELRTDE